MESNLYPGPYTYLVTFDKMIHGVLVTNKCYQVDLAHAERYTLDIQLKNPDVFNVKIQKV